MRSKFTFKSEVNWMLIAGYLIPAIGFTAMLIYWIWTQISQ
jgi:hypothetical protein